MMGDPVVLPGNNVQTELTGDFRIGAKVVYPSHGIGVIDRIESKPLAGLDVSCYIIRFSGGMIITAPVKNATNVGLRAVISAGDADRVIEIICADAADGIETNWSKRQKSFQEKLKSGSLFDVAAVYRDLLFLRENKGLSFGEQQVFDNARKLILTELAEAKGMAEASVGQLIQESLVN